MHEMAEAWGHTHCGTGHPFFRSSPPSHTQTHTQPLHKDVDSCDACLLQHRHTITDTQHQECTHKGFWQQLVSSHLTLSLSLSHTHTFTHSMCVMMQKKTRTGQPSVCDTHSHTCRKKQVEYNVIHRHASTVGLGG